MPDPRKRLLYIYLNGFLQVFLHAMVASVLLLWCMQAIAFAHGLSFDWQAILRHLFLSLSLLAFFPGQTFWTFRLTDRGGRTYTIVGREDDAAPD